MQTLTQPIALQSLTLSVVKVMLYSNYLEL